MIFYNKYDIITSVENQKKRIVILGAGFAGLGAAVCLARKLRSHPKIEIILVDEKEHHIYTPDLYEIATAYNKNITEECLTKLKETVATPIPKILSRTRGVEFIRDQVIAIKPGEKASGSTGHEARREVALKHKGTIPFDFLVLALGSVKNYYNIPGLDQFSYPLKSLTDALGVCCHLDIYFHSLWKNETKKEVNIIVGGGGATGVEFACELPGYMEKICAKYNYPREHVKISVIEGSCELTGQGEKVTALISKRFQKLGIKVQLSTFIKEVKANSILTQSGDKKTERSMDILIWTGGVMPNPLIRESFTEVSKNGSLLVNQFLQSEKFPYIFAGGDNACFLDAKTGRPLPMLAQVAFQQRQTIATNIVAEIMGQKKVPYKPAIRGVIIPLGGKYAFLKKGNFIFRGFFIWVLRRLVDLRYFISILPFRQALKKWIHDTNVFVGND